MRPSIASTDAGQRKGTYLYVIPYRYAVACGSLHFTRLRYAWFTAQVAFMYSHCGAVYRQCCTLLGLNRAAPVKRDTLRQPTQTTATGAA